MCACLPICLNLEIGLVCLSRYVAQQEEKENKYCKTFFFHFFRGDRTAAFSSRYHLSFLSRRLVLVCGCAGHLITLVYGCLALSLLFGSVENSKRTFEEKKVEQAQRRAAAGRSRHKSLGVIQY